ncbi:MAG TPA: hypothetical protein VE974_10410 [Thermoanaerobaculia bacterium]|nr:hypothetical protein [Thermoanaerobaculia bacterium]
MTSHHISKVFLPLAICIAFDAAASNLGFWTAEALRGVAAYRGMIEQRKPIRVLALHRKQLIRGPELNDPRLFLTGILEIDEKRVPLDLYDRIAGAFARAPFDCIVLSDLSATDFLKVEQFVRNQPARIAVVATTMELRTAPFAVVNEVVYTRQLALKAYRMLDGTPRRGPVVLDRVPIKPAYRRYVNCEAKNARENATWSDEGICYQNAIARRDKNQREEWEHAIADLAVAVMIQPDEAYDYQIYKRGWGYERYFPRLGLADFLARLPDCAAVHRELKRSIASSEMRKPLLDRCPAQSVLRLDPPAGAIPSELVSAGVDGDSELLPQFAPSVLWSDIAY